MSVVHESSIYM